MMTIRKLCPGTRRLRGWLAVAAVMTLLGCSGGDAAAPGAGNGSVPAVEAVPARTGSLPLEEALSGLVRARNQVAIRPEITAPVVEVMVRIGQRVVRGQPLVRLDDETLREQLRQSVASLRLAEATAAEAQARVAEVNAQVVRTRALAAEELVSELDVETQEAQLDAARAAADASKARVEQARATADERRAALARTVVRAPVAGRVGQRNAEVGMVADSGTTLFLIGEFDDLIVEVPITQDLLGRVVEGTPVEIEARAAGNGPVRAAISRISPFLERGSFSTAAEIDVTRRSELSPGMFVTVRVLYGESEQATLVPASALWEDPRSGVHGVFVVETAHGLVEPATTSTEIPLELREVRFRPVELLAEGRGTAGVGGVGDGEWVVTVGQQLLTDRLQNAGEQGGVAAKVTARVRPTTWERVLGLQSLQREDLLEGFLQKQQVLARAMGAKLPVSEAAVEEILERRADQAGRETPGAR